MTTQLAILFARGGYLSKDVTSILIFVGIIYFSAKASESLWEWMEDKKLVSDSGKFLCVVMFLILAASLLYLFFRVSKVY